MLSLDIVMNLLTLINDVLENFIWVAVSFNLCDKFVDVATGVRILRLSSVKFARVCAICEASIQDISSLPNAHVYIIAILIAAFAGLLRFLIYPNCASDLSSVTDPK